MRHYFLSGLLVGSAITVAGCTPVDGATGGETGSTTRTFAVSSFDAVRAGGAETIRIVRGPTSSVVATGPSAELDRLDIATRGSVLNIGRKPSTA